MADIKTYKKTHPPKPMIENDSGKPHQGVYIPQHPEKVVGGEIIYRSGWEFAFARWCDLSPSVLEWGTEPVCIQYRDVGKLNLDACHKYHLDINDVNNWPVSNYYPDFYVNLRDANDEDGTQNRKLIIEIKPKYQTERPLPVPPNAKLRDQKKYVNDVRVYIQNLKKWESAIAWCKSKGFEFKVYTEVTLKKMGIID